MKSSRFIKNSIFSLFTLIFILVTNSCFEAKADFSVFYNDKAFDIYENKNGSYEFSSKLIKQIAKEQKPLSLDFLFSFDTDINDFKLVLYKNGESSIVYGNLSNQLFTQNSGRISILLEPYSNVTGFSVSPEVKIQSALISSGKIGWSLINGTSIMFPEKGGKLCSSIDELQNSKFSLYTSCFNQSKENASIYFSVNNLNFDSRDMHNELKVKVEIADRRIAFNPEPKAHNIIVNTLLFKEPVTSVKATVLAENLQAVILDLNSIQSNSCTNLASLKPINTDVGLVQNWDQSCWRNPDFELFQWTGFPGILIFDFADYSIQDDFLKRLAFFVEKTDSIGTLMSDEEIRYLHGYNAHDYKPEDLARFFQVAEEQNFMLNERENLLREILLNNGVIIRNKNGLSAGNGALISISKESDKTADYLRTTFLVHEGMHGVYFVDGDFRNFINQLYSQTDEKSIEFVKAYFVATPSLNYNINDNYLLKNEFMGYLVQQRLDTVANYFGNVLPNRKYVGKAYPELCEYMKETKAQGLVEAGEKINDYIFERWGFNLGRDWKATSVPLD